MTTIKDVAEHAHVSIATVSRVLNNTRYVSPEVARRVHEAIDALHYQHNVIARNLRRSQSQTLGIIIPDSINSFFAEVAKGVEDACFDQGFVVVMCNTNNDKDKAASYLTTLYQQRAAGIIVVSPGDISSDLREYVQRGYPIVVVDRPLPDLAADTIASDNFTGAKLAVEHLLALGHRRIGFVTSDAHRKEVDDRWGGAQAAMFAAGVAIEPALVYRYGDFLTDSGYKAAQAFYGQPTPPTAIFAFNDLMAFGVLSFAYDRNIRVPQDLSVIGFDDIAMAAYAVPSLTTIAQPKYEMGRRGAEILLKRIQGDTAPLVKLKLPAQLVMRHSTASPPRALRTII